MRLLLSLALASLSLAPAASAAKAATVSWGKLGISFEQYRQDSADCARAVYYLDVSGTEAAQVFKRATSHLENNETNLQNATPDAQLSTAISSEQIVQGTQPEKRFQEVRDYQLKAMEICLTDRGYKRFALTSEQADHLNRLKKKSEARREYLYRLSVDPEVLKEQGV
jgi:hypothetical protein